MTEEREAGVDALITDLSGKVERDRAEMTVVVRWLDRMANELRASTGIVKSGDRPRGRDASSGRRGRSR